MESTSNQSIREVKGPSLTNFIRRIGEYPAFHFHKLMGEYGEIVRCNPFFYLISNPDIAKQILNLDQKDFSQEDFVGKRIRTVFGKGLVISTGDIWASERKLLNPIFKPQAVHLFISEAIIEIDKVLDNWGSYAEKNETFDLVDEMGNIAIMVSGKVLFDTNFKNELSEIKDVVRTGTKYIVSGLPFYIPFWIPTIAHLRLRRVNRRIDNILMPIVRNRLRLKELRNDLADTLINTLGNPKASSNDQRLMLDEMKTMLAGGYFPVACCLSVFWHVLGQHPGYFSKLKKEIRSKPIGYNFTEHFYRDFPITTKVIFETMRLYPVAFSIWRKSKIEQNIDGLCISKGKTICISIFNIHRNPKFWEDPDKFNPERFDEARSRNRPRHHFMPFGWGNRNCIGDNYAMMIIYLTIIRIIQKFDIEILPVQELKVKSAPLISPKKVYAKVSLNREG